MRVAVISDIHANLHALDAVLAEVDEAAPDELWCLGDLVGYGPRPNECCERVRQRATMSLVGNHDLAVLGTVALDDFVGHAAEAALWTREVLTDESRAFIESLATHGERHGVALYHGSPLDPVWSYVLDGETALASLEAIDGDLLLVGHSHIALQISLDGDSLQGGVAPAGTVLALEGARWLLNPGSVGQPRDGDPDAAWLLLDLAAAHGEFRRVPYDVERTQAEIREAGLPDLLGARLAAGQ